MLETTVPYALRKATLDDADDLAQLINYAGEGFPHYLWERLAEEGETAWDVGRRRARRDDGSFSYRNAMVAEVDGKVAASLIGYVIPETPEPIDYEATPPMFIGLQELENLAPGSWYVNVLAAHPQYRGQGIGSRLLAVAEQLARHEECSGLSIIVSDANPGARRLYERCGYIEKATRPAVKEDWVNDIENWVLLTKPFD